MVFLLGILLVIAIFLEGTVTTLPLVLIYLLYLTIIKREAFVFPLALLAGIFLDILSARSIGMSSLFFICFLFLILLYQRKYEIDSYPFVAASSFLGALAFLSVFGYGTLFWQSVFSSLIALLLFAGSKIIGRKK